MELVQKYNVVTKESLTVGIPTTVITDQDEIKKLYGDKDYRIETDTLERKLTIKDNVLVLKKSVLIKSRREGKQFFAKKLEVRYLKIDFDTGNFLTLYSFGGIKKKRQLIIRRNCFDKLEPFFDFTNGEFWGINFFRESYFPSVIFDNQDLQNSITDFLVGKYSKSWLGQDLMGLFTRIFIQKKGIKAPDGDVDRLITRFYPTQKFLKKNNNKLVQSVLDYLGMNDSYTVKLVHKHPELDYRLLKTIHHVLGGSKYLSNVDPNVFGGYTKDFIDQGAITNDPNITKFSLRVLGQDLNQLPELTDKEKGNLVKMLNDVTSFKTLNSVPYHMIVDHLNMIGQVRPYNPNIGLHSTTFRTFDREHIELSEEVRKIRKGYVVSYKFHPLMVKDIETPLGLNGEYVPYILKDENDYTEEGKYMKHCVGSYYDKDKSIIISLRNSTEFTLGGRNERWTIEFDVKNGDIIQCMGKQNSAPPIFIMDMIKNNLLRKTRTWSRTNRLKCIEKVETPLKINGKEIDVSEYNTHDIDLPF